MTESHSDNTPKITVGKQSSNNGNKKIVIPVVTLLILIAAAVVFLLPSYVEKPTVDAVPVTLNKQAELTKPLPDSPWQDAQIAKQRRDAQDILSKMLTLQQTLEKQNVNQWAAQGFTEAMQMAENADLHYRQREFEKSKQLYSDSLAKFEALTIKANDVLAKAKLDGMQAIENNDVENALSNFELATSINVSDKEALKGLERAMVLQDVVDKVKQAESLLADAKLLDAEIIAKEAVALDSESTFAVSALNKIKQAIVDDNFNNAMSSGFSALSEKRFEKAIAGFTQATKIKPNNSEAKSALISAENKQKAATVFALQKQAAELEKNEKWAEANDLFNKALVIDSTLVTAKVGEIRTGARAELNDLLDKTIENPSRLSSSSVNKEASELLAQAKKISAPGPILQRQINQLSQLIVSSAKPVKFKIQSDNQTLVSIKHIGQLGAFANKNFALVPGTYTAVGTRAGYRDVIHTFNLMAGTDLKVILVQCTEKVVQ